jgi:thiamine monophosphate kinase
MGRRATTHDERAESKAVPSTISDLTAIGGTPAMTEMMRACSSIHLVVSVESK